MKTEDEWAVAGRGERFSQLSRLHARNIFGLADITISVSSPDE
jgi:hypothetical protein